MDANTVLPPHFNLTGQVTIQNTPDFMGNYSFVYRGLLRGHLVAVKVIKTTGEPDSMKRKVTRERVVWGSTDHRNIQPFQGYAEDPAFGPFGAFVSPWTAKGDASRFLKENGVRMIFAERMNLWKGVIEGVIYLHDQQPPIVHGDLKPGNVLIDDFGVPKICDFGLARIFLEQGSTGMTTTSEHTGTARYLAPELVASEVTVYPTLASDVYALGCLGLEFIFLQQPFSNHVNNLRGQIFRDLRRGLPPAAERPQHAWPSNRSWPILKECWNSDPEFRPYAYTVARMLGQTDFTFPSAVVQRVAYFVDRVSFANTMNFVRLKERFRCLLNLCLVSKAYRASTTPFLYRTIYLNISRSMLRLQALVYALESLTIKTLLPPHGPDGYGTTTKLLFLIILQSPSNDRDLSIGIRDLVNRLPGLRHTIISSTLLYIPNPKVPSLTTLTLYKVDLSLLFDQIPILHILRSIQHLSMEDCVGSTRSTRTLQGSGPRVYLPNLLELSFHENDRFYIDALLRAEPFSIISAWAMPRLRSLDFSSSIYYNSTIAYFDLLRMHGSLLQHLTVEHPNVSAKETSDILHLCSNLISLKIGTVMYNRPLFSSHPRLRKLKASVHPGLPVQGTEVENKFKGLVSYMQMARASFPSLVEAELILQGITVLDPALTTGGASFHTGDNFITYSIEDKSYRVYDGEDTFVEVTGGGDVRR